MFARSFRLRRSAVVLVATAAQMATPAFAQTPAELAQARSEFREGLALETAGNWAGALAKFRAVANVKMTPQVRFNIAVCEAHLGKLVAALGDFQLVANEALDGKLHELAEKADEHAKALAARVPTLTIVPGAGAATASITLDGVTLGAAALGKEMNLDPGAHEVTASLDGERRFSETVRLDEGGSKRLEVTIASEPLLPEAATSAGQPPRSSAPETRQGRSRTIGWLFLSAGGASAVAGAVFLALRAGTITDLDAACHEGVCPESARSTADRGKLYTGLAEGAFVAGAAGLTIGTILLLGRGTSSTPTSAGGERPPSLTLRTGAPGTVAGASLTGCF